MICRLGKHVSECVVLHVCFGSIQTICRPLVVKILTVYVTVLLK